jgi:hypothetical protein
MMAKIAALFTDEFIMKTAVSNVRFVVVEACEWRARL